MSTREPYRDMNRGPRTVATLSDPPRWTVWVSPQRRETVERWAEASRYSSPLRALMAVIDRCGTVIKNGDVPEIGRGWPKLETPEAWRRNTLTGWRLNITSYRRDVLNALALEHGLSDDLAALNALIDRIGALHDGGEEVAVESGGPSDE